MNARKVELIKMSRKSRNKPETNLQLMTEITNEERPVITLDCGTRRTTFDKEEARKPLYLKRV